MKTFSIHKAALLLLTVFLFTGCTSTKIIAKHAAEVGRLRSHLPYITRIENTHSMSTIIPAGSTQVVSPLPYDRLQTGMAAVYLPLGFGTPVCHFVGGRIGTDSWQTHGMNQSSDLNWGWLLTRQNYIGVIYPIIRKP